MTRFDVVIVGAGSAGAVLALRLAEDRDRSVLLVEAGPDEAGSSAPAGITASSFFDALDVPGRLWPAAARQPPATGPTPYLRGLGVGGSSAINGMLVGPGIADDYDDWERAGASGWGWAALAPWFTTTRLVLNVAEDAEVGALSRALLRALPRQAALVPLTRFADGRRASVADVYLGHRPKNLRVLAETRVDCLLIEGRRVTGLRFGTAEVEAAEVIVAAGAIGSPVLLLRSGVDTAGVGDNLCEHPGFGISLRRFGGSGESPVGPAAPAIDPHALAISTGARMSSAEEAADLQLLALEHLGPTDPDTSMLLVGLMKAYSRGTVRLSSSGDAEVDFHLLDDERDVRRLRHGIDQVAELLTTAAFRAWSPTVALPAAEGEVRAGLGGFYHAAGTCALGTVLDPECRVRGYTGLRVCDASIMPSLPRANPHLTVVAMAERLAWLINNQRG